MNIENNLWVEKYRPKELDDMVLNEEYKKVMQTWVIDRIIPNTLLVGKQGSGKTTLARILISKVAADKRTDVLEINGSAQRGIDTVRDLIEPFLQSIVMSSGKIKIVFIDEFDMMTQEAQTSLRHIIEKYSRTGRFLATANYESKIIPALHSRFQTYKFNVLSREYIKNYCINILEKESVKYDPNVVDKIILEHDVDVRKIIGTLQSKTSDNVLSSDVKDIISKEREIRSFVTDIYHAIAKNDYNSVSGSFKKITTILDNCEVDYVGLYSQLFHDDNTPTWVQIIMCDYANSHPNSLHPRINFQAMIIKIISKSKEIRKIA